MTQGYEEGVFRRRTTGQPALYYYVSAPAQPPVAVVGLLHGYADYGGRYRHVAEAWAERGIETVALDMRGHGRAEGRRGYCDRFDEYVSDAAELVALVQERAKGTPAFLFGHSFGGLVATTLLQSQPLLPFRGLVLSAPYFGLAMEVPQAKVLLGRIASIVAPKLAIPTGLHGAHVTHDVERARAYNEDPLVFKLATARWFTETAAAQERALARAASFSTPLYVVMGSADPVAKVARARAFFDAASSRDKTWDERPGLFHEVLNEPEWKAIASNIADWMLARVKAP